VVVTSGGVWKTPSPSAGIWTPLFKVMVLLVMRLTVGRYRGRVGVPVVIPQARVRAGHVTECGG
jgi:hypothetical protein